MSGACKNKIKAGDLVDPISIETATDGKDTSGTPTLSWSEWKAVNALVQWIRGSEKKRITKETAFTRVNFTIRRLEGLDTKKRIVFDGNIFNILGILEIDENRMFVKVLTELVE